MIVTKFLLIAIETLSFFVFVQGVGPALTVESYDLQYSYYDSAQSSVDVANAPALVSSLLTITDVDSSFLISATIDFASSFALGDTLSFEDQGSITGSFDPSAGILALTGLTTLIDWQTALRSVTFKATPDLDYKDTINYHTKTLRFQVTDDSSESSNAATRAIYITTAERVYTDEKNFAIIVD